MKMIQSLLQYMIHLWVHLRSYNDVNTEYWSK